MQMTGGDFRMLGPFRWLFSKSCTVPAPLNMALSSTAGSQAHDFLPKHGDELALNVPCLRCRLPPAPFGEGANVLRDSENIETAAGSSIARKVSLLLLSISDSGMIRACMILCNMHCMSQLGQDKA